MWNCSFTVKGTSKVQNCLCKPIHNVQRSQYNLNSDKVVIQYRKKLLIFRILLLKLPIILV